MSYSPRLLKTLGISISAKLVNPQRTPEQRLFQAIIVQAFEDALTTSGSKLDVYQKIDAHDWFVGRDEEFEQVCWLAGFDPDIITDNYKRLRDTGQVTFSNIQQNWARYRKLYKDYRAAKDSEERSLIMKEIRKINFSA